MNKNIDFYNYILLWIIEDFEYFETLILVQIIARFLFNTYLALIS